MAEPLTFNEEDFSTHKFTDEDFHVAKADPPVEKLGILDSMAAVANLPGRLAGSLITSDTPNQSLNPRLGRVAPAFSIQKPWIDAPGIAPTDPDKSIVGIDPADIPSGANTTQPWLTIPISSAFKTAAGIGQYVTSPHGATEIGASMLSAPAKAITMAKWAMDMGIGAVKSIPEAIEAYRKKDWQGLSDALFNAGVMTAGGALLGREMSKPSSPEEGAPHEAIGKELGLGVREPIRNLWQFDVIDPKDGQPAGFSIKEGSTLEEVKSKADKLSEDLVERLGPTPDAEQILRMTPEQMVQWKKVHRYGNTGSTETESTPGNIAAKLSAEDVAKIKSQSVELRTQSNDLLAKATDNAGFLKAGNASLKSAILREISEDWDTQQKNKTPQEITTPPESEPLPPETAKPTATGGSGKDVTGIAQRVREKVAAAGQETLAPTGQGISAPDSVERGEQLLKTDPSSAEKAMFQFEQDPNKAVSADAMAVGRAKLRQLAQVARSLEAKGGPEYEAAFKARSDWAARMKKMQTEWHKSGMAQQGEQDIDTGTFTGLREAYMDATGKDFTPEQKGTAKKVAARVSKQAGEVTEGKDKLANELRQTIGTPEQKKVWDKVKEYLDQGMDDFDDIRVKAATDLGMTVKKVTDLLTRNKRAKFLADDLWRKQEKLRRFKEQAKRWLKTTTIPTFNKAMALVPKTLFAIRVGFHGTVAMGTHAPMLFFEPMEWGSYFRNYAKMYRNVGGPTPAGQARARAYYEMQVQDLLRDPNYPTMRRAGLQVDPSTYEEYAIPEVITKAKEGAALIAPKVAEYFNAMAGMGNRGYATLKMLRRDMFNEQWNALPKTARIDEMAAGISDGINHVTGVTKKGAPKGANIMAFAPRLMGSRAMWLFGDPIKAANTFINWKTASDAEKYFAVRQVKEKAWVAGTMMGMLALNKGILSAIGSDQKVNLYDPFKSDFLKFKIAGKTISYGNAMITMARLPVRLYQIRESDGGKLKNLIYPDESSATVLKEYARSQASPFASLAMDLWFKGDWQERPLPNSNRPVPKRLRAQGVYPYTWGEFWLQQALPIPAQEAMHDVWKNGFHMNDKQISDADKIMATASVVSEILFMMGTGARITDDIPKPVKK